MTLLDAIGELDTCRFLKITRTSIHAARWSIGLAANVTVRRKKNEMFYAMVLRAAALVRAGHRPVRRVPPLTRSDSCACGRNCDLIWNEQLKQRLCRRCSVAWSRAAKNNDMPLAKTDTIS